MGDFKIKISDVMRYILLGCIETILCLIIFFFGNGDNAVESIQNFLAGNELWKIVKEPIYDLLIRNSIIALILAVSIFYILGYVTQLAIRLFLHGNLLGTGIGEMACFIKFYPASPLNRSKYSYPDWLYYSYAPDRVVETFQDIIETESDPESRLEFSYARQLFQGIALSLMVFSLIIMYFALSETSSKIVFIISTLICLAIFILLTLKATLNRRWVLANKIFLFVFPFIIGLGLSLVESTYWDIGLLVGGLTFVSLIIATELSRKQIRRIDILAHRKDEKLFDRILVKFGIPRVYVLTRVDDSACPFLSEQLESIAMQDYPNIKSIILIDDKKVNAENACMIEELVRKNKKEYLKIQYSRSKGTGAAALAHEVRQVFINYAADTDISICLDADDKFSSSRTVSRIVGKMYRTASNICLLRFETFGNTNTNFAKNYHNDLVKMLAKNVDIKKECVDISHFDEALERKSYISPSKLKDTCNTHLISTLGWVKCYSKTIVREYQKLLNQEKCDFAKYCKYEDFPDIVALLFTAAKICAVADTSILFRKRDDSVTAKPSVENYRDYIPHFMKLSSSVTQNASENNSDRLKSNKDSKLVIEGAKEYVRQFFIPYKFVQYLNVVYYKTVTAKELSGFTCQDFYNKFKAFYAGDSAVFHKGIIDILNQNLKTKIFDDFPEGLQKRMKEPNMTFSDIEAILSCYGINPNDADKISKI